MPKIKHSKADNIICEIDSWLQSACTDMVDMSDNDGSIDQLTEFECQADSNYDDPSILSDLLGSALFDHCYVNGKMNKELAGCILEWFFEKGHPPLQKVAYNKYIALEI